MLFTDVLTSGSTAIDAVRNLREAGAVVRVVVGLFDREEGAGANLKKEELSLRSYLTKSDMDKIRISERDDRRVA